MQQMPDLMAELRAIRSRLERLELSPRIPSISTVGGSRRQQTFTATRQTDVALGASFDAVWFENAVDLEFDVPEWANRVEASGVFLGNVHNPSRSAVFAARVGVTGGDSGIDPEFGLPASVGVTHDAASGGVTNYAALTSMHRRSLIDLAPTVRVRVDVRSTQMGGYLAPSQIACDLFAIVVFGDDAP